MSKRKTLHRAALETRNFMFEAFGASAAEAREALHKGLKKHARQYGIIPNWWAEFKSDIRCDHRMLGVCYRDDGEIV